MKNIKKIIKEVNQIQNEVKYLNFDIQKCVILSEAKELFKCKNDITQNVAKELLKLKHKMNRISKITFFLMTLFLSNNSFSQEQFKLTDTVFQVGQKMITYEIKFDFDKYSIQNESYPFLDSLASFMLHNDSLIFKIANHTDTRGSDKYSIKLSQRRAMAIVDYLIKKGIQPKRLVAVGYEGTLPLISPETISKMKTKEEQELAHQKNRRTEFVIIAIKE